MKKNLILTICLIVCLSVFSQNNNEQLELTIENDKLVLVDKYYTSGLLLTYKKNLERNFIFKKTEENKLQLNLTLGNQTYTPSNLMSIDTRDFDRPYAGWFFVKTELARVKENSAVLIALETGITGEEALSGKLQSWLHKFLNIDVPTWAEELEYKFLINLKAKYIMNKEINKHNTIQYVIEPSLGTKDIYLDNSFEYYFGRFNNLLNSSRNGILDNTDKNEFFGFAALGYKYVIHNTLIQGSLNYEDILFTTFKSPHVFKAKAGLVFKYRRSTFKFAYNFNTKETPKSTSHSYGTISFSRNF